MVDDVELIQFRYSPYNEKVRWALDLKRVPHRRKSVLPGPHARTVRRLTGQTQTPIVKLAGRWLAGSSQIVAALDDRFPNDPLLPTPAAERSTATEIEAMFDHTFGPAIRRASLSVVMKDLGYMADMFACGKSTPAAAAYRMAMPLAASLIRRGNGLDEPEAYEKGMQAIAQALDWIEAHATAFGCLVGDSFSVADLTVASILAPVVNPPDSPMSRPAPQPEPLRTWLSQWHDHPGAHWVRAVYRRYRGVRADFEGPSTYG